MLSRMMLRAVATQALLELETDGSYPTFAGPNVFDSRIFPAELDDVRREIPVCAVYTDTQKFSSKPRDPQALVSNTLHEVQLCFEICVAENGAPTYKDTGELIGRAPAAIVQTDSELEAILDLFEAQILYTLQNPSKMWSQAFGNVCREITSYESSKEADGSKNLKLAFRKIDLGCLICPDPMPIVIPSNVKCITSLVSEVIPRTGTYLDDMLEGLALHVANGSGNLSTAISIMTSTFGGCGGILWPALQRIGIKATLPDEAAPKGELVVANAVLKIGG
jgi:hypothetical protein